MRTSLAATVFCVLAAATAALELYEDGAGRRLELDPSLKLSTLAHYNPSAPSFYPSRKAATGFARLRLDFSAAWPSGTRAELAHEIRGQWTSSSAAGTPGMAGLGAAVGQTPWRMTRLDWGIASDQHAALRQEIDRAWVAHRLPWGEIRLGRQAIGLGRGVLFSAIDLFAPFSPSEPDREWRRGVDAARIEYGLGPTSSAAVIGVFGRSWDDSALLAQYRGYFGEIDGEIVVGKYARDAFAGGSFSSIWGGGEVHLELALFATPEPQPGGGLLGNDYLVGKAVLGGSYTFGVGNGLTALIEYHYSGFGAKHIGHALAQLRDPRRQERFARGDSQILGRHALALHLTYPLGMDTSLGLLVLQSAADGSGLLTPSIDIALNQTTSLRAYAYLPWGAEPSRLRLRSEYGASPLSLFAQVAFYF